MKKENRLLKNEDFKKVLEKKTSVSNKEYIVYARRNTISRARLGISVGTKVGNSVIRHKVKRQINEMLKDIIDIKNNIDYVIIVRNCFLEKSFDENKENLIVLWKKLERKEI